MRTIITGSITAGEYAADIICRGDDNPEIVIYEKSSFCSFGGSGLACYLNEDVETLSGALRVKSMELESRGVEIRLRHEVTSINPKDKCITVKDHETGNVFETSYDRLILAFGSYMSVPNVPGINRMGIQTMRSVEDLLFLKVYTKTPYVRDIVILGGGWTGVEAAKAFLKMGRNVRIIEKNDSLLSDFDPEVSRLVQADLENQGIQVTLSANVRKFAGRTFVEEVVTDRGSFPCDLCILCTGTRTPGSLLAGTGLELDSQGRIKIASDYTTNIKDIYASGDCAVMERDAGGTASLKALDYEVARTGLTEAEALAKGYSCSTVTASGKDRPGLWPDPDIVTIKLLYDEVTHKILGAQGWGRSNVVSRINALAVAIRAGMTAEELYAVDFAYSGVECAVWDPVQIACAMAAGM